MKPAAARITMIAARPLSWTPASPRLPSGRCQLASGNGNSLSPVDSPDISLVDGAILTASHRAGGSSGSLRSRRVSPCRAAYNGSELEITISADRRALALCITKPSTVHGADLLIEQTAINHKTCNYANGNSFYSNHIYKDPTGTYGFVITDANGNPVMPPGDKTLACFSNCGKYEFPKTPVKGGACDPNNPNDPQCFPWLTYCAGNAGLYGHRLSDRPGLGTKAASPTCTRRAIGTRTQTNSTAHAHSGRSTRLRPRVAKHCEQSSATGLPSQRCGLHPHVRLPESPDTNRHYKSIIRSASALPCANVTGPDGKLVPCVGDDTIHQVMHGAYTWPNDPETFDGDSPVYRIVFSPEAPASQSPRLRQVPLCSDPPPITTNRKTLSFPLAVC